MSSKPGGGWPALLGKSHHPLSDAAVVQGLTRSPKSFRRPRKLLPLPWGPRTPCFTTYSYRNANPPAGPLKGASTFSAPSCCSEPRWQHRAPLSPPETQDYARPRPLALNDNYGIVTITSWLLRCFTLVHSLEFWVLGWVTHYFSHCLHKLSLKQLFALTEKMSGYLRELDSCSLIPTSHKRASQQPQSTTFLQISPSPWPGPQQGGQTLNSARDFERFIMSVAMGSSFPRLAAVTASWNSRAARYPTVPTGFHGITPENGKCSLYHLQR